jgi:hypothetical protein
MTTPSSKVGDTLKVEVPDSSTQEKKPGRSGGKLQRRRTLGPLEHLSSLGRSPLAKGDVDLDATAPSLPPPQRNRKAIDDAGSLDLDLFALYALAQTSGAQQSTSKGNIPDNYIRRANDAVGAFVRRALRVGGPDAFNGKLLTFLSPQECEDRVDAAIGIEDERERAAALAQLATGMASMTEPQRARIVDAATGLNDEWAKADALSGLGAAMAQLTESQRDRIVTAAIGIKHEGDKAVVLAGLGAAIAHLSAPQRGRLIHAATGIQVEKYKAIALAGLGAGMAHLERV